MENASKRQTYDEVRRMIERQRERYGWEFLFLGANMDAVSAARRFGILEDRAVRYECDAKGTALNFEVVSETIGSFRAGAPLAANWKEKIEQDYEARGKH
jgi:hypothetical protein